MTKVTGKKMGGVTSDSSLEDDRVLFRKALRVRRSAVCCEQCDFCDELI